MVQDHTLERGRNPLLEILLERKKKIHRKKNGAIFTLPSPPHPPLNKVFLSLPGRSNPIPDQGLLSPHPPDARPRTVCILAFCPRTVETLSRDTTFLNPPSAPASKPLWPGYIRVNYSRQDFPLYAAAPLLLLQPPSVLRQCLLSVLLLPRNKKGILSLICGVENSFFDKVFAFSHPF